MLRFPALGRRFPFGPQIRALLPGFLFLMSPDRPYSQQAAIPGLLSSERSREAAERVRLRLATELSAGGMRFGNPVFIRITKEEGLLELFVREQRKRTFRLFKTYPVAAMSGHLGPKEREGDLQAPEGFYYVSPGRMNPNSRFHLSFNLGYPNTYDRGHGRTGSHLMVHGNQVSIGCFAMTDPGIEEIYTLCHAALAEGQPFFRVHCFPFHMTAQRLARERSNKWYFFWKNLQEGYDFFERSKTPPNVRVSDGRYVFE